MVRRLFIVTFLLFFIGCEDRKYEIIYRPIEFGKVRKKLTLEYLKERHGIGTPNLYIRPRIIVIHWTACSLQRTFDTFMDERQTVRVYRHYWRRGRRYWRSYLIKVNVVNVSTQFIIDRDGTIYQTMPENVMARHVIGLNWCSIGIENVGSQKKPLTEEQLYANLFLIRYIKHKYPDIEYLIGHCEYRLFEGHYLWKELTNKRTYKIDPGQKFIDKLRNMTTDLHFKKLPKNSKFKATCY